MTTGHRSGFTIIEVLITLTLLAVISGSVGLVSKNFSQAYGTSTTVANVDAAARRGLTQVCGRIKASSRVNVNPTPQAPFNTSQIDYVQTIGFVAPNVIWGNPERLILEYSPGEVDDGVDNDGNGLIDECRVVWVENAGLANERRFTLTNWVSEFLEGEILNGLDDNGNGLIDERGFSIDLDGDRVFVRLTIEKLDPGGMRITRTVQKTVSFRIKGV